MAILSVSIDLTGSTLVKQALVEASTNDVEHRRDMYGEFLKLLFEIERDFYQLLIDDPDIDFARLFLVKTIGDELWYAYEIDDDEEAFARTAWAMCSALLTLFSGGRYLGFDSTTGDDGHGDAYAEGDEDPAAPRVFDLPIKAHIDVLSEAIEVNVERYEYLKDVVSTLSGHPVAVYTIDDRYLEICNRLNLGSAKTLGSRAGLSTRTDYIGLQVDRFFRLAKFCVPRLLGVGEELMRRLPHVVEPASFELEHLPLKALAIDVPNGADGPRRQERKYAITQLVHARDMKGISEDYTLYHVFGGLNLGDAIYAPQPTVETLLEPTRAFLAAHGFYALEAPNLIP